MHGAVTALETDPIRIATGECECESDSGGLMDVVELPVFIPFAGTGHSGMP
jgi:hypothetical protein